MIGLAIGLVIGLMVGAFVGMLGLAIAVSSHHVDEWAP